MSINRKTFFASVRKAFGPLKQSQVNGFNYLLDAWEARYPKEDLRFLAYPLATTWHETDKTMEPIEEYGRGKGKKYGPTGYWGRGYVQLTWDYNYLKAQKRLKELFGINVDLMAHPEKAMVPEIAVLILFVGMTEGWFTGKRLATYFNSLEDNPKQARRIINGTDKQDLIAGYHTKFLEALKDSQEEAQSPTVQEAVEPLVPAQATEVAPKVIYWPEGVTEVKQNGVVVATAPKVDERPNLAVSILVGLKAWLTGKL